MKVAIVGRYPAESDDRWVLRGSSAAFHSACSGIGKMLSKGGHDVYLQYDNDEVADTPVVEGYLKGLRSHGHKGGGIHVWHPARPKNGTVHQFEKLAQENPTVFSYRSVPSGKWDSARFQMCYEADITVAIAGQARTEITGLLALAASKPLIAIGSFGGAAESLISYSEHRFLGASALPRPLTFDDLKRPWSDQLLELIQSSLQPIPPRIVIIHGRNLEVVNEVVTYITTSLKAPTPVLMLREYKPGETLPEKWERVAGSGPAIAIAIASADDEGRFVDDLKPSPRARENVWLEVGWFWGQNCGREKILLLCQGFEPPSDLQGLERFSWKDSPLEGQEMIRNFLQAHGLV